ncbi:hypothetical protein Taro_048729 [Colocasia esculenta]|uniref:Retrotransposon gag domain-containing protein n=1 Tax=Colocasia esculenta TaxID=4460 RepID=A0A843X8Z5_COLES|nr:hypothetical protein [Colocasia esculenta]
MEKKAAEFAALKQKGISVAEYEAQFARLAVYAPHFVGTERLKANRFMDGLRPMFIERLGPHNIQTYTEMVQRAHLVEDTMAKVEGMRGKDNSKPGLLVAEELWNDHKKLIFFPFSSAASCTNRPLEVDQRSRPCEHDGLIGHILRSCCDSKPVADSGADPVNTTA